MKINPSRDRNELESLSRDRPEDLRERAHEFEAMLTASLFQNLSNSLTGGTDPSSPMGKLDGLLWLELARELSARRTIGLADMVERELAKSPRAPGGRAGQQNQLGQLDQLGQAGNRGSIGGAEAPSIPEPARDPDTVSIPPAHRDAASDSDPYKWMAPVDGRITSAFGRRTDPIDASTRFHGGIDVAALEGTMVRAPADGEVVFSGPRNGYGNTVILEHVGGLQTVYAHLREIDVRRGDRLARGEKLGEVGQTGRATGPHLHFEVRRGGSREDPEEFL
jgi:murein DD-endopeptidase MepM/ murein hydrolase activator NlpD